MLLTALMTKAAAAGADQPQERGRAEEWGVSHIMGISFTAGIVLRFRVQVQSNMKSSTGFALLQIMPTRSFLVQN